MIDPRPNPRPNPRPGPLAAEIEALLLACECVQERLLGIAADHRRALSRADAAGLAQCAALHEAAAEELRRLEADRRRLIGPAPAGRPSPKLTDLAARLDEPDRGRIGLIAERVRVLTERVAAEQRILRTVTAAVSGHLDALVRQVARALAPSGTYTRQGAIATGPTVARGLDLRR